MKRKVTVMLVAVGAVLTLRAASSLAVPPFTFAGRVTDYAHIAFDKDQPVEVRVLTTDGTLIAKSFTSSRASSGYNFVVDVPVATTPVTGFVTPGTQVVFSFIDPDGKIFTGIVPSEDAVVGESGGFKRLTVVLATDSDHDGVADEYVDALGYLMRKYDIQGNYDPKADYDKDGVDNYHEYCAGTNPFDATDSFRVLQMSSESENAYRLRFLANQGRSYTVETATDLSKGDWVKTTFTTPDDATPKSIINTGGTETGYRSVDVLKQGMRRFWRLLVQ